MIIKKLTTGTTTTFTNDEAIPIQPQSLGLVRRNLLMGLGLVFMLLAVLGAALPLIPCTPFVLLAGYCFARSSPRLHKMLLRSRLFGRLLQDWQQRRAIHANTKRFAILLVMLTLLATLYWLQPNLALGLWIGGTICIGMIVIARIPSFA